LTTRQRQRGHSQSSAMASPGRRSECYIALKTAEWGFCVAQGSVAGGDENGRAMTRREVERLSKQLWKIAETTARSHRFRFSPHCARMTQRFMREGVRKLPAESPAKRDKRVALLKKNTKRYVEMMVTHSIRNRTTPPRRHALGRAFRGHAAGAPRRPAAGFSLSILFETNFRGARSKFCPCFPFC
jgi:hypothetical protein